MKESNAIEEATAPGRPNTAELKAMALRQQQQIDTQHQLLAAKEQRLRFLKNQEIRNATAAAEGERLRRLRERVEAQESKLRRLRALRGQVDLQKTYNVTLSNDLDSIRALFSEKEKELSLAVAKVEALTKQLEELRRDRRGPLNLISTAAGVNAAANAAAVSVNSLNINGSNNGTTNIQQHLNGTSPAARELDKLRRELMYRNQLSLQQDARLHLQREALHQRQAELRSVDQRIYELQSRLQKKKATNLSQAFQNQMKTNQIHMMNQLNQTEHQQKLQQQQHHQQQHQQQQSQFNHQNAENINYTNNNGVVLQFVNNTHSNSTAATSNKPSHSVYPSQRIIPKGNVAAVEPYIHMPQQKPNAMANKQKQHHVKMVQDLANLKLNLHESNQKNANNTLNSNLNVNVNHIQFPESDETKLARQMLHMKQHSQDFDLNANADITDFVTTNKIDSKLHTLYNTVRMTKCSTAGTISTTTTTPASAAAAVAPTSKMNAMGMESFDEVESTINSKFNENDSAKVEHDTETKVPKSCLHQPSSVVVPNEMLNAINKSLVPSSMATSTISTMPATTTTTTICASSNGNHRYDGKTAPKSKLLMTHQIPSGNLVVPPRKPISSVAPTSITPSVKSTIPSPRVHAVAPNVNSTPIVSTTELLDKSRPALPPKPNKNSESSGSSSNSSSSNESSPTSSNGNANHHRSTSSMKTPMAFASYDKGTHNENKRTNNIESGGQQQQPQQISSSHIQAHTIDFPIKAKPLTIKKQPLSEQPRLRSLASGIKPIQYSSRRIEMPSTMLLFPENERIKSNVNENKMPSTMMFTAAADQNKTNKSPAGSSNSSLDENDKSSSSASSDAEKTAAQPHSPQNNEVVRRQRSSMSDSTKVKLTRRVSFDPLALLLDASLEGELELVQKTAAQVPNPSAANDEGITALHNAICAGHFDIVKFLVEFGCDVNAQDSDGWTPLHCAASCNNLAMVKFLVESGACLFASTLSDHETPAEKCEEDEEGFDGCSEYLYSIQEKLGIMNNGEVYAVFSYEAQQSDELSFEVNDQLIILRKGDDAEREWWWAKMKETGKEGYVPRNLLGLYARIPLKQPISE